MTESSLSRLPHSGRLRLTLANLTQIQPDTVYLRDGDVILYRRSRSLLYQCRYKLSERLVEKRQEHGPGSPNPGQIKPPTSSYSLVRTYQREVERQRKMVLKAEHAHQRLLLVVQGLKKLFSDKHFVNLLRAEGLDTLPKYLAERIDNFAATT